MKYRRGNQGFVLFFLLGFLLVSSNNKAQIVVTLGDCLHLAIEHSYQLQSDSLLSRSLQMFVKEEQAAYYPRITGSAGFSGLFLSPYTFGQHYMQTVADWDLGRFWYRTADIQQKQLQQNEARLKQRRLEIAGVITGLYLDVLQRQLDIETFQSKQELLDDHLKILEALWKAGTIQQLDVLQARSAVNRIKEALMQKQLQADQVQYVLSRLMGVDATAEIVVQSIAAGLPSPESVVRVPDAWLENHPSAVRYQKEYEAKLLMKQKVSASFAPHIQAFSGFAVDNDPTGDGNYFLLGMGATIPIWSWKEKEYQMHNIDFQAESIQKEQQNVGRELSVQLGQLVRQIKQYKDILDFQQHSLANDREVAQVAEMNYNAGLTSHLDFLTAQQTITEAEIRVNATRNQYLKSVTALWLLTGQIEKVEKLK